MMMPNAFGIEDDRYEIAKAERSSGNPSMGRRAARAYFGPYHAAATAPKGERLRSAGSDFGATTAGMAPGAAVAGAGYYSALKNSNKAMDSEGKAYSRSFSGDAAGANKSNAKTLKYNAKTKRGLAVAIGGGALALAGGHTARQMNLTRQNRKGKLIPDEGKVSKGSVTQGLKMAGNPGMSRSAMTGGKSKRMGSDVLARLKDGESKGRRSRYYGGKPKNDLGSSSRYRLGMDPLA